MSLEKNILKKIKKHESKIAELKEELIYINDLSAHIKYLNKRLKMKDE